MIVALVPEMGGLPVVFFGQRRPLIGGDESCGIHDAAITDDQTILGTGLGQGEIRVLDGW